MTEPTDAWNGAEPFVVVGEMRACNGTTIAGGALAHGRVCPVHGETTDALRATIARLTAELAEARDMREIYANELAASERQWRAAEAKLALQEPVIAAAKAWRRWRNFEYRPGEINPHLLTAQKEDLDLASAVDAVDALTPDTERATP